MFKRSDKIFSIDDVSVRSENGCFYVKPAHNDVYMFPDGRNDNVATGVVTKEHPERGIRGSSENPIVRLDVQNDRLVAVLQDGSV